MTTNEKEGPTVTDMDKPYAEFDRAVRHLGRQIWLVVEPVPLWVARKLSRLLERGQGRSS